MVEERAWTLGMGLPEISTLLEKGCSLMVDCLILAETNWDQPESQSGFRCPGPQHKPNCLDCGFARMDQILIQTLLSETLLEQHASNDELTTMGAMLVSDTEKRIASVIHAAIFGTVYLQSS